MSIDNSIISAIFSNIILTDMEMKLLKSKLKLVSLKKGTILLKEDELVKYQYYVLDGCLRTYFIDPQEKEHTIQFAIKDWWISDYTAFYSSSKAILNIEGIRDSTLLQISHDDLEILYKEARALETYFRRKMEGAISSFQRRILGALSQPATERYINFIASYPNIEQSVKNYHIASYLGITTESLSRIRKEIAV